MASFSSNVAANTTAKGSQDTGTSASDRPTP